MIVFALCPIKFDNRQTFIKLLEEPNYKVDWRELTNYPPKRHNKWWPTLLIGHTIDDPPSQ